MKNTESRKVIWAVDPFAQDKKLQIATFNAIAELTKGSPISIEPVAVLSADQLRVPTEAFKDAGSAYRLEAETLLTEWIQELDNPKLCPPKLLLQDLYSTQASIDVLLKYAKESKASLIAMGTHNKKIFERFLVGSFAETMMIKCDIPMLIVNPHSHVKKISRILFPTDFSTQSRDAFDRLLPFAKALGAEVKLYYKFEYIVAETIGTIEHSPNFNRYLRADVEARRRAAIQWVERANQEGVKVDVILDEKTSYVAEGVLGSAKRNQIDLVAMAANSGTVAATLLGSIARQVVRGAETPVWVMHTPIRS